MPIGLSYTSGAKLSLNKTFTGLIATLDNCDLPMSRTRRIDSLGSVLLVYLYFGL